VPRKDQISLRDAARMVAASVYPDVPRRRAEDRVRQAIADAVSEGNLSRTADRRFSKMEFLWWAGTKWPTLHESVAIPQRPIVITPKSGRLSLQGNSPDAYVVPTSKEELLRAYLDERRERLACERKLEAMILENSGLRAEKAAAAAKKKAISAIRSASAKRPRRSGL